MVQEGVIYQINGEEITAFPNSKSEVIRIMAIIFHSKLVNQ